MRPRMSQDACRYRLSTRRVPTRHGGLQRDPPAIEMPAQAEHRARGCAAFAQGLFQTQADRRTADHTGFRSGCVGACRRDGRRCCGGWSGQRNIRYDFGRCGGRFRHHAAQRHDIHQWTVDDRLQLVEDAVAAFGILPDPVVDRAEPVHIAVVDGGGDLVDQILQIARAAAATQSVRAGDGGARQALTGADGLAGAVGCSDSKVVAPARCATRRRRPREAG